MSLDHRARDCSKSNALTAVPPAIPFMSLRRHRKHTILLVEDDRAIADAVATLLEDEGYQVFRAENGQQGMDVLKTMPRPCLILLDMMMPVLDGHGFMRLLRSEDILISIPVVVVSATQGGIPENAKGFLRKPFELEALVQTVNEHCT